LPGQKNIGRLEGGGGRAPQGVRLKLKRKYSGLNAGLEKPLTSISEHPSSNSEKKPLDKNQGEQLKNTSLLS